MIGARALDIAPSITTDCPLGMAGLERSWLETDRRSCYDQGMSIPRMTAIARARATLDRLGGARSRQERRDVAVATGLAELEPDCPLGIHLLYSIASMSFGSAETQESASRKRHEMARQLAMEIHGWAPGYERKPCYCPASSEYDPPCPRHGILGIGVTGAD